MTNAIDFIAGLPGIHVGTYIGGVVAHMFLVFEPNSCKDGHWRYVWWSVFWPIVTPLWLLAYPFRMLARWWRERKVEPAKGSIVKWQTNVKFTPGPCPWHVVDPTLSWGKLQPDQPDRSKAVRIPTGGEVPKPVTLAEMNRAIAGANDEVQEWAARIEKRLAALEKREHAGVRAWMGGDLFWVCDGTVLYVKGTRGWERSYCDINDMAPSAELPQPEADRLADECRRALGL